jgi:hypothetical protein
LSTLCRADVEAGLATGHDPQVSPVSDIEMNIRRLEKAQASIL